MTAHNYLQLQAQEIQHALLASVDTRPIHAAQTYMYAKHCLFGFSFEIGFFCVALDVLELVL